MEESESYDLWLVRHVFPNLTRHAHILSGQVNRWLFTSFVQQLLGERYDPLYSPGPGASSFCLDLRARMLERYRGPSFVRALLAQVGASA